MKTYFILDGYSLIYKSYFAFIRNPMMNPKGENSSAIFGFFRTLFSLFDRYNPEYFLVTLDSLTPTFRHHMYPEYKPSATRCILNTRLPGIRHQRISTPRFHVSRLYLRPWELQP